MKGFWFYITLFVIGIAFLCLLSGYTGLAIFLMIVAFALVLTL